MIIFTDNVRPCIIVATCETRSSGTGMGPVPYLCAMVLGHGKYYLRRITFLVSPEQSVS